VQVEFEAAHQNNDLQRIEKIQKLISIIEKLSAPPPEIALIQQILEEKDETKRTTLLQENSSLINDEFIQALSSIISEGENRKQSPELVEALRNIYKSALRIVMEKNLKS
jgi:predicted RND superfamily exporter protein